MLFNFKQIGTMFLIAAFCGREHNMHKTSKSSVEHGGDPKTWRPQFKSVVCPYWKSTSMINTCIQTRIKVLFVLMQKQEINFELITAVNSGPSQWWKQEWEKSTSI
jgi:hypothetical protein